MPSTVNIKFRNVRSNDFSRCRRLASTTSVAEFSCRSTRGRRIRGRQDAYPTTVFLIVLVTLRNSLSKGLGTYQQSNLLDLRRYSKQCENQCKIDEWLDEWLH